MDIKDIRKMSDEDLKKKKRQQAFRVFLTEVLMGLSVVCLTAFLT